MVLCPFHQEKTPSLRIWKKAGKSGKQGFHCFGCGKHGPVTSLIAYLTGCKEAEVDPYWFQPPDPRQLELPLTYYFEDGDIMPF